MGAPEEQRHRLSRMRPDAALSMIEGPLDIKAIEVSTQPLGRHCLVDGSSGPNISVDTLMVVSESGRGSFATVDLCYYTPAPGQPAVQVAVKLSLRTKTPSRRDDSAAFLAEARLLYRISCRYIVESYGYGYTQPGLDNSLFIVQEHCSGGTLLSLIMKDMAEPQKRVYTNVDALRYITQIAEALCYLHTAQPMIVHRDVKAENVMLRDDKYHTSDAVLIDLGLHTSIEVPMSPSSASSPIHPTISMGSNSNTITTRSSRISLCSSRSSLASNYGGPLEERPPSSLFGRHSTGSTGGGGLAGKVRRGSGGAAGAAAVNQIARRGSSGCSITGVTMDDDGTPLCLTAMLSKMSVLEEDWSDIEGDGGGGGGGSAAEGSGRLFSRTGRVGSLMYMAPEVFNVAAKRGNGTGHRHQYNESADTFSFAMLMYEVTHRTLLRLYFTQTGNQGGCREWASQVAVGHRPPLMKGGGLPTALLRLISGCWCQRQEERPTMESVLGSLRKLADSGEMQALDDEWLEERSGAPKCGCVVC